MMQQTLEEPMSKAAIVVNRLNECVNFLSLQILLSFELLSFLALFAALFQGYDYLTFQS